MNPVINSGEYNWKPLSLPEIKNVFQKFQAPWIIAGGWAIDLFLERQTREHSDVDVLINRKDQLALQDLLSDWDAWVADPPGTLRPIKKGEWFNKGIQDIWVRKNPTDPWQFQVMLFDTEEDFWIFKRDESIRRKLDTITLINKDGFRILSPEIQLLYKSKAIRDKDQHDFDQAIKQMSATQKQWLKFVLIKVYENKHPWLEAISI